MKLKQIKACILIVTILYMLLSLINTVFWSNTPYSHTGYYLKEQLLYIVVFSCLTYLFDKKWQKTILVLVVVYKFLLMTYTILKFIFPLSVMLLNMYYDLTICIVINTFVVLTLYFLYKEYGKNKSIG